MKNFIAKYNAEDNHKFINELLRYSNENNEFGIGYPRCEDFRELLSEVELYENTLNNSICVVYDEEKPIAIGGFLYSDGEDEGYFIGPIITKEYFNEENAKAIMNTILESKNYHFEVLKGVCTEENQILSKCYIDAGWKYLNTNREMCYTIDNKTKEVKWKVNEICKDKLLEYDEIFNILDRTFKWNGNKEEYTEFLKDEYKVGCVMESNAKVIGIVVWAYLKDVDFSRLDYIVVDENYRKKGIGESMINYVINDSNKNGVKNIYLSTGINNKAANVYSKVGFYDTVISSVYERKQN